jgi:hypothetical protein
VCVITINKSPCQVCVSISESARNKTQSAGKKDSLRGGKKTLAKLASTFKKLLANPKFHSHLASWRVVISTPASTQANDDNNHGVLLCANIINKMRPMHR